LVNVVYSQAEQDYLKLRVEAGKYRTIQQHVSGAKHLGKTHFRWNILHQSSAGHIASSGFESWSVSTRFDRQINRNWSISVDGRYVPYQFDDPSMDEDVANLGNYAKIRRGMLDMQLLGQTGKINHSFHVYSNLGHHRFYDGFESHDFTYGFSSYQWLKYSSKLQFGAGMDLLHYGGKAKNVVFPAAPPKPELHAVTSLGSYLLAIYSPLKNWNMKGGIRYHHASLNINKISPSLGISFFPFYNLKIYANWSDGFRLPTLQELYLFPPSNENLDPEDVKSYELGGAFYFDNSNYLEVCYFKNHIKNKIQITANPASQPPFMFMNSGKVNQWGMEYKLVVQPSSSMMTQFSYSYLDPDQMTTYNPAHMFKYLIQLNLTKIKLMCSGKFIKDIYADNNKNMKLPDYHVLNVALSYPIGSFLLDVQLRNVLNRYYEILPGYPAPDLHFLMGVTYQLSM